MLTLRRRRGCGGVRAAWQQLFLLLLLLSCCFTCFVLGGSSSSTTTTTTTTTVLSSTASATTTADDSDITIRVQQEAARLLESVGLRDRLCQKQHPYYEYHQQRGDRDHHRLLLLPELFPLCGGADSSPRPPSMMNDQRQRMLHEYDEYDEASSSEQQQLATGDEEQQRKGNRIDKAIDIAGAVVCVAAGALAAGLTVGLLSLDPLLLLIKSRAARTATEREQASQILPVIRQHHLLLVTLLLLNTAASEALPIFLHGLVPEYAAVLISVVLVLLFGEILPSAIFTGKHQIAMAARWVGAVRFLLWLFWPVAYPISRLLDWVLGEEHDAASEQGDKFNRGELAALIRIQYEERLAAKQRRQRTAREAAAAVADLHYTAASHDQGSGGNNNNNNNDFFLANQQHQHPMMMGGSTRDLRQSLLISGEQQQQRASFANRAALHRGHHRRHSSSLHVDEVAIAEGALQLKTKTAFDLLVPHRKVWSVPDDTVLDEAAIVKIFASGYSRVPVHCANEKTRIRGILLTRQLIVVNKNESVPLAELPLHIPHCVGPGTNLVDLVNLFQTGGNGRGRGGHMALVCARPGAANAALERGEPLPEAAGWIGIITLEDCLEALLQEQILDEQDAAGRPAPAARTLSADDTVDGATLVVQSNNNDDMDGGAERGSADGTSIQLV